MSVPLEGRRGSRYRIAVTIAALSLAIGLFLFAQLVRYREVRAQLQVSFMDARERVGKLEVVAAKLDEFRIKSTELDGQLERLNLILPPVLDVQSIEEELRSGARGLGIHVDKVEAGERTVEAYVEAAFTLSVAASREAVERFALRVHKAARLYRVDDIFLPGPKGSIRIRAFSHRAMPRASPSVQGAIPPDPFPTWLFSLEWERELLSRAERRRRVLQVVERQVQGFQARERLLVEKVGIIERLRAAQIPPVETELRPKRLTVAKLRVLELAAGGQAQRARVAGPYETSVELSAGDILADAVVKHVSWLGLFVETDLAQWIGDERRKVTLRFLPPEAAPPITIGHDTTWITGPLLSDGTPDYGAWLNQKYGAGVTPENNAVPALRQAMAGLAEGSNTFWDDLSFRGEDPKRPVGGRVQTRPWVDDDCPECVARLERSGSALSSIAEAVKRPRHFVAQPTGARLPLVIPSLLPYRRAANALAGRGMLRLGRGELAGAREDAVTIQKLALLLSQGHTLIETLVAIAIRGIGMPLLTRVANAPEADSPLARGLLAELVGFRPMRSAADVLDQGQRFSTLDATLAARQTVAAKGGAGILERENWRWPYEYSPPLAMEQLVVSRSNCDWDEVLRLANRWADLSVAAVGAGSQAERRQAKAALAAEEKRWQGAAETVIAEVDRHTRAVESKALDRARALDEMGRSPEGRRRLAVLVNNRYSLVRTGVAWNEAEAQFRMAVFSVALAARKLETGGFPERLEALSAVPLPDSLAPSTRLPGYTLRYAAGPAVGGLPRSYALITVPEEVAETGNRAFCADSTGAIRFTTDGKAPSVANGICDPAVPLLR